MGTAHSCAWSSARARLASSPSSPLLVMAPRRLLPPALPTRPAAAPPAALLGIGAPGLKGVYLAAFTFLSLSGGCRCLRGRGGGGRCPPGRWWEYTRLVGEMDNRNNGREGRGGRCRGLAGRHLQI